MKHLILWALALGLATLLMSFAKNRQSNVLWRQTNVKIYEEEISPFVRQVEIRKIIKEVYPASDSLALEEINIALLEETLDNHPSINKAEVYSLFNGSLNITVKQHEPLARILTEQKSFYLLNDGLKMPLSPHYSAAVPLITGSINDSDLMVLADFWNNVYSDSFFKAFFTGLTIKSTGQWVLHPMIGDHEIELGKPQNLNKKLKKLKIFYQQGVNSQNLDSLKSINLKYSNQVVCQKI
jgi:cell division protein FtsQ